MQPGVYEESTNRRIWKVELKSKQSMRRTSNTLKRIYYNFKMR